ncbi:MAG: isopeptide-forming domain-containing fimbrial protein, partial [bacterium]
YDINGTATNGYGKSGVNGGYYLIRNTSVPEGETYSDYIVFVVMEDTAVSPKTAAAPTPEKKVTDKNDSYPNNVAMNQTGDSADYDIGDQVPYRLSVQLPSNFTSYTHYYLVFEDEMSKGLTLNSGAKIHYGANDTAGTEISFEETAATGLYVGSKTYKYATADLKSEAFSSYNLTNSSVIWIEYSATLNKDAVIGASGNPNKLVVEYSNNPTGDSFGKTEPDETTVFTFKLVFNKVDSKNNPLTGADFVLEKWIATEDGSDGTWTDVTTLGEGENRPGKSKTDSGNIQNCVFTFSGLDDGNYRLRETVTPAGYNTLGDIEFTVTASHDVTSPNPQLQGLTGANGGTSFVMTYHLEEGMLSANIVNESGAVLPTTGAEGTMLLLLAGTVMAFICIVILVTRRRMRAAE